MEYVDFLVPTQLVRVQLRGEQPMNFFVMKTDWDHKICTGYEFEINNGKKTFSINLSHKYQFLIDKVVLVTEDTTLLNKLFPMPSKEEPDKIPLSKYKIDDKTKAFLSQIKEYYTTKAKEKMDNLIKEVKKSNSVTDTENSNSASDSANTKTPAIEKHTDNHEE